MIDENARIADDIHDAYEEGYADGKRDAVVHGKWVFSENDDMFYCTNCKNGSVRNDYPYCHWCGAKMDLLDDDTKWEVTENGVKVTKYNCTAEEIEEVKAIMGEKEVTG